MEILHEGDGKKERFYMKDGAERVANMEYVFAGDDKFIIEHTEVNPKYEGQGLGKQLVAAAVTFAREKNLKIIPLCPYAHAQFKKVPEYADVWFGK